MTIDIIAAIIAVSVLAVVYLSAFCTDIRHCRSRPNNRSARSG
jgi:hypothetical protein